MNGLQAIRERILDEARQSAEQIGEQSDKQISEILSLAETEKARLIADAAKKGETQAEALLARARSTAAMERRKMLLQSRQDVIDRAIDAAADLVRQLPDEARIAYYRDLIEASSIRTGEVILSASDRHLSEKLLEGHDGLKLSDETGRSSGGLVLRQGLVEDNLTLALTVASRRPELVRLAADTLFPERAAR